MLLLATNFVFIPRQNIMSIIHKYSNMVSGAEDTIKPLFHFYTIKQPHKHGLYESNDKKNGYLQW